MPQPNTFAGKMRGASYTAMAARISEDPEIQRLTAAMRAEFERVRALGQRALPWGGGRESAEFKRLGNAITARAKALGMPDGYSYNPATNRIQDFNPGLEPWQMFAIAAPALVGGGLLAGALAGPGAASSAAIPPLTSTVPTTVGTIPAWALPTAAAAPGLARTLTPSGTDRGGTNPPGDSMPDWLRLLLKGGAAALPLIGSQLYNNPYGEQQKQLEALINSFLPTLQRQFEMQTKRQEATGPLFDSVLNMAMLRLPTWARTGGGGS